MTKVIKKKIGCIFNLASKVVVRAFVFASVATSQEGSSILIPCFDLVGFVLVCDGWLLDKLAAVHVELCKVRISACRLVSLETQMIKILTTSEGDHNEASN